MNPLRFQILGEAVQLARPELLPLVAAAIVAACFVVYGVWRRRQNLRRIGPRLVEKLAPGFSVRRAAVRGALTGAGLLLLAIALARPQAGEKAEQARQMGIDLVVALDASRSMHAQDVRPSRLDRAKLELSALIDGLQGDRVGVVTFAGQAFVQCPLTSDYGAAKMFLRAIDPESMPSQGTAVAQALDTAAEMLRSAERGAKNKVVLLLTDGEDHEGDLDAAIERLEAEGVRVFALGIGSAEGTPIPLTDAAGTVTGYLKDRAGNTVITRLDEAPLRRIAEATGGTYVPARGGDIGMGEIQAALQKLEKSEFDSHVAVQFAEVYHLFAFPGFALLLLGAAIGEGRRR